MRVEKGAVSPVNQPNLDGARNWLADKGQSILEEQVEIARVPAPPFQERSRAELIAAKLKAEGLLAEFDEIGNLLAWFPAVPHSDDPEPIIVAAHVDTVFGPETSIEIRQDGKRWIGPGITDNARGLAVSLAVLRALRRSRTVLHRPILFSFTVGEEGPGDLRGVKHLFRSGSPLAAAWAFIAVDGSGLRRIINQGLGCNRYRITASGPGGHSWNDWGRVNPVNAVGEFIHQLTRLDLPEQPRTTLTVARVGGGISINAIPTRAWVELDLRSQTEETLLEIESRIHDTLTTSLAVEEQRAGGRLAELATRALSGVPEYAVSSTDANVPLARGVPAIAIGAGGKSADTHTENEWFEDTDGEAGALRLLAILGAIAGA
jgi:acetylornithine deacetylase/succinyl-diaminopimelate desuccinylase-like protein